MSRHVNDNIDDTTVYKNICCIYRDHSVSSGGHVPQDFKRQKIVREVPDVLRLEIFILLILYLPFS